MIPVQDNWLHIQDEFLEACEQIPKNNLHENYHKFKQLGFIDLMNNSGHVQDLLECVYAMAEHDVVVTHTLTNIAVTPMLTQQINHFEPGDNTVVSMYKENVTDADVLYDWLIVPAYEGYNVYNTAEKIFEPEHSIKYHSLDVNHYNTPQNNLPWFLFYNVMLTASAVGGLAKAIKLTMKNPQCHEIAGKALADMDSMKLTAHRNLNHAMLHLEQGEEIPMYDRMRNQTQAIMCYNQCVNYVRDLLIASADITVAKVSNQLTNMNIQHLSLVKPNDYTKHLLDGSVNNFL